jgi:hypothetical protein
MTPANIAPIAKPYTREKTWEAFPKICPFVMEFIHNKIVVIMAKTSTE